MTYEGLMIESEKHDLIIREKDLPGYKGRIYKNRVAIRRSIPTVEKPASSPKSLATITQLLATSLTNQK